MVNIKGNSFLKSSLTVFFTKADVKFFRNIMN